MKNLFNTILLLLFSSIVSAQDGLVDTLITPISANMLQDTSVKSDVFSILNGKADGNLYAYRRSKLRNKRHFIDISFVSNFVFTDYEFILGFSEPLRATKEKRAYQTSCSSSLPFMDVLSYSFHGIGGPTLTTRALSVINQEIVSVFTGKSIRCVVKAYKSKDHRKKYCHLHLESGNKNIDYIFIIKDGYYFYQCVVQKNI
jgi:hypothetical protein